MKICIAASEGGHLTEAMYLESVFGAHDWFLISYRCPRVEALPHRKYMVPVFPENPLRILPCLRIVFRAFFKERPEVVLSTGSEIALPVFLAARIFGAKTVFIETLANFAKPSLTARLLYPFADRFFVQNRESLAAFGPRAEYHGAVV
jgi:UDP-N-acetylglucosamine:LPS N-acetylglucosamine transferase